MGVDIFGTINSGHIVKLAVSSEICGILRTCGRNRLIISALREKPPRRYAAPLQRRGIEVVQRLNSPPWRGAASAAGWFRPRAVIIRRSGMANGRYYTVKSVNLFTLDCIEKFPIKLLTLKQLHPLHSIMERVKNNMKLNIKINTKISKNAMIIAIAIIIALLALLVVSFTNREQPRENLVAWQPATKPGDNAAHSPSEHTTANAKATLTRSNGSPIMGGAGGTVKEGPQHSYYSRGWNIDSQWWQLNEISTQGYRNIELTFTTRGSNTGPKNFTLEYSTDADDWLPLTDSDNSRIAYAVGDDNKFHKLGPYTLTEEVSDNDLLYIRFLNTDAESIVGGPTKSTGTNYIADIIITGISTESTGQ